MLIFWKKEKAPTILYSWMKAFFFNYSLIWYSRIPVDLYPLKRLPLLYQFLFFPSGYLFYSLFYPFWQWLSFSAVELWPHCASHLRLCLLSIPYIGEPGSSTLAVMFTVSPSLIWAHRLLQYSLLEVFYLLGVSCCSFMLATEERGACVLNLVPGTHIRTTCKDCSSQWVNLSSVDRSLPCTIVGAQVATARCCVWMERGSSSSGPKLWCFAAWKQSSTTWQAVGPETAEVGGRLRWDLCGTHSGCIPG